VIQYVLELDGRFLACPQSQVRLAAIVFVSESTLLLFINRNGGLKRQDRLIGFAGARSARASPGAS
jgi:hypothetical protein